VKFLEYSHPARTNVYSLNRAYSLDELRADGLNDDQIKILFKPVNFEWEDEVKVKAEPEIKIEQKMEEDKVVEKAEVDKIVEVKQMFNKGKR